MRELQEERLLKSLQDYHVSSICCVFQASGVPLLLGFHKYEKCEIRGQSSKQGFPGSFWGTINARKNPIIPLNFAYSQL